MRHHHIVIIVLVVAGLIAGCASPSPVTSVPTARSDPPLSKTPSTPTPLPSPTPPPTSTPTPVPPKELTVCQAEEPNTLFVYGGPSRAAHNVLEAIYDGPVDSRTYQFQPVILDRLPSLDNGDVTLRTVSVTEGDTVADVNGQVVDLAPGVTLLNADGQRVTFEEGGVITATQTVVTFTLRAGVTWADGQPLTADDSRYAFEVASHLDEPSLRQRRERAQAYQAVDERTLVWTGVPGYRDAFYSLNFFHPLPRHVLGGMDAEQLLKAEVVGRKPLGWGPFTVEEWVQGERITLVRNPHYFRASEGLPRLDRVIFRFTPDFQQALSQLATGTCDLITQEVIERGDVDPLLDAAEAGAVRLITSSSSEWEHLDFGIEPARWMGPSIFAPVEVRQAVAHCVDRERIASEAFPYADAVVAHSYIAPQHPLCAGDRLHRWEYDPAAGRALLDDIGWRDDDGDGIRAAHDVPGVVSGTPFSVTLITTSGDWVRERTARILGENLAACQIGLAVKYLSPEEFYADGPDGPVFGRQFDLALFSWLNGLGVPCELYLSDQIPREENWWATSNDSGYASEDYDRACRSALDALPEMEAYGRYHREAQRIFSHDLPVLPLYFVPKLVVVRPGVTGVILNPSEISALWNIEAFDVSR